jgi:RNA polymerase sigma-70 factor (ECF subfamily)
VVERSIWLNVKEGTLISQDKHLLKRMRCGDRDALRQIYEKYRDDLFTVAVSLLQDVHTSEDCLQDTFASLVGSVDSFNVRRNLKSYLISCVANRARDRMRKKAIQMDCPLEQLSCLAISDDPADEVISREESGQILRALSELPYEQKEVFVLHVQGELKFKAIAKLQDVSIKTVQSRYRYAIEKLRALLEKGKRS